MTTSKPITGILVLVTTIGALLLLAGPAAATSKPARMTKSEYRALMLRSQGLNELYGVKPFPAVSLEQGQNQRFAASQPTQKLGMTKAEYDALMARSEGLDRKYGLGIESLTLERGSTDRFSPGNPTKDELVAFAPSETSNGFAWSAFIIGAAAALGLVLIAGGAVAHGRQGRGVLRARSS